MANKRGNGNSGVISDKRNLGITDPEYWQGDFSDLPFYTAIEKILEMPAEIEGAIIRAAFSDVKQVNTFLFLLERTELFKDERHKKTLKRWLAATAAMGGRARLEALFAAIRLLAPDMYRSIMGMPRYKAKKEPEEKVMQSVDRREYREVDD